MRKLRILYYHVKSIGCYHYRVRQFRDYLESTGLYEIEDTMYVNGADWVTFKGENIEQRKYDFVIMQRPHSQMSINACKLLKNAGIPVIYDIDDLLTAIDPKSTAYSFYSPKTEQGLKNIYTFKKMVSECDYVIASTNFLRKELKHLNKNITVIENGMDRKYYKKGKSMVKFNDDIIIGYGGSTTHLSDIKEIEQAIVKVVNKNDNVKLMLLGTDYKTVDTGEYLAFKDIPDNKKIFIKECKVFQDYINNVSKFDIGIAPLVDSRFNKAKSSIKYLELAMLGIPCVASDVEPYKIIRNNNTGFKLKNKVDKWAYNLQLLIDSPILRHNIGIHAKEYAYLNHEIEKSGKKLNKLLQKIFKEHKYILPMQNPSEWKKRDKEFEATLIENLMSKRK